MPVDTTGAYGTGHTWDGPSTTSSPAELSATDLGTDCQVGNEYLVQLRLFSITVHIRII